MKITLAKHTGGDWIAVYCDDELFEEGHSLAPETYLEAADVDFDVVWSEFESGRATESLKDLDVTEE